MTVLTSRWQVPLCPEHRTTLAWDQEGPSRSPHNTRAHGWTCPTADHPLPSRLPDRPVCPVHGPMRLHWSAGHDDHPETQGDYWACRHGDCDFDPQDPADPERLIHVPVAPASVPSISTAGDAKAPTTAPTPPDIKDPFAPSVASTATATAGSSGQSTGARTAIAARVDALLADAEALRIDLFAAATESSTDQALCRVLDTTVSALAAARALTDQEGRT